MPKRRHPFVLAAVIGCVVWMAGTIPAQAANLGAVTWNGTSFSPSALIRSVDSFDTFTIQNTGGALTEFRGQVSIVVNPGSSETYINCSVAGACTVTNSSTATFRIDVANATVQAYVGGTAVGTPLSISTPTGTLGTLLTGGLRVAWSGTSSPLLRFCQSTSSDAQCTAGTGFLYYAEAPAQLPSSPTTFTGGSTVGSGMTTTALPAGTYRVNLYHQGTSRQLATGVYTISSGGGSGGSSSSTAEVENPRPADVLQQFGKPLSGTCDAAAPASLNWAGVASGGWGESWAQWANGGRGGAVCTRTLTYSESRAAWVVQ